MSNSFDISKILSACARPIAVIVLMPLSDDGETCIGIRQSRSGPAKVCHSPHAAES
jgi:hypothetical protein